MSELGDDSGRWLHSLHESHGDVHHTDDIHEVKIMSSCTQGTQSINQHSINYISIITETFSVNIGKLVYILALGIYAKRKLCLTELQI